MERRAAYLPNYGGIETLSAPEVRTLDELVRIEMRIDWLVAWLDAHQLVYGRGKHATCVPVLRSYHRLTLLARALRRDLGLQRRTKTVQSLADYLREKDANGSAAPPASAVVATVPAASPAPAEAAEAAARSEVQS